MTPRREYSLWLMPSGHVYDELTKLNSLLSREYASPIFEPHVTLIGELIGSEEDMLHKTSQLAAIVRPYTIRLTRVGYSPEFSRCLFIKAEEADDVMQANLRARQIFGLEQESRYTPHLSLMYGRFPPETKEEIIRKIGKEFELSFLVNSIHLFSTGWGPENWYRVREFIL